jgi:hypothetical protein
MDTSRGFAWFVAIAGRIAFLVLWLLTPAAERVFSNALVPVLGVVFAPLTALTYTLISNSQGNASALSGFFLLILVLMFSLDLAADIYLVINSRPKS